MNEYEARLAIVTLIRDVLIDLTNDGESTQEDIDAMGDAADIIVEGLGFEIVSVEGSKIIISVEIPQEDA